MCVFYVVVKDFSLQIAFGNSIVAFSIFSFWVLFVVPSMLVSHLRCRFVEAVLKKKIKKESSQRSERMDAQTKQEKEPRFSFANYDANLFSAFHIVDGIARNFLKLFQGLSFPGFEALVFERLAIFNRSHSHKFTPKQSSGNRFSNNGLTASVVLEVLDAYSIEKGTRLCKIVDASTQWEPYLMLAATFSGHHNVCNTLYSSLIRRLTRNISLARLLFLRKAKVFRYGLISLIVEPCRSVHLKAMEVAKEAGALLSCDLNLRLPLWPSSKEAHKQIMSIWDKDKVIKVSDNELEFLTESDKIDDETAMSLCHLNLKLLLVTLTKVVITILRYVPI
uniref:Probable fructokinase-4 n=1 Tax=Tanacetum cinerariifolium TaxID=118510 RepID=A0A699HBG2_TANCI|nr:probable fructokinase-4 [Tanacetum cinerariifolium]